ncbi:MAG: NAD-dependent epimerase/dehydratase family protein [Pseudomonadota bacterium]
MARVLLTGSSGFVGNNLARRLLADGHELHLVLRENHSDRRIRDIRGHVRIHLADLRDEERVNSVVEAVRPEWVFHLAAHGAYPTQTDALRILHTNTVGTANLVTACLRTGFEALVHAGSSSEYGLKDHPPRETERPEPNSYYAVAKASATMFCTYTAQSTGTSISTLRLYSVYGPYEEPTRLMPTLIREGFENRLPPVVNPETARDFVYVDDVVHAFVLAATVRGQEPGAVYNVGTGVQTTIRTVVDTARRVLNITDEPQWASMNDRIWDTNTWVADNRYAGEKLGWTPKCPLEEGFRRMVEWCRANPALIERV